MRQQKPIALSRQMWVVFRGYLSRPGFRWTVLMMIVGYALRIGMTELKKVVLRKYGANAADGDAILLLILFSVTLLGSGGLGLFAVFFTHARRQLMGETARLMPQARAANLLIAGLGLIALCAFFAWLPSGGPVSYLGEYLIMLAFAILVALAVCRPWLIPIPLGAMILIVRNRTLQNMLDEASMNSLWIHRAYPANFAFDVSMIRFYILLLDVAGLILLANLARPRALQSNRWERLIQFFSRRSKRPSAVTSERPHRFIESSFARKLHRRFGAHDWRAAGVAGCAMGALSLWFALQFESATAASMLTLLLALLPGGVVALGWPARWGDFDLESLYPVSRSQFVTDLAASVIFDAVEFWITSTAVTLGVLVCLRFPGLHEPRFWAAIGAGAMMQCLWLGAIFFIGQRRQILSYFLGLAPFAVAMFITLEGLWRRVDPVNPRIVVTAAMVEMIVGLAIFLMTWAFLQRGPRSAQCIAT